MPQKTITLQFESYPDANSLPTAAAGLLQAAKEALSNAYAPYSRFQVAAAALLENGQTITACNTENAAYPMCLCAERAALAAAASQLPHGKVIRMAITVKSPRQVLSTPASPCGACRQVLAEHEKRHGHQMELILQGESGPIYCLHSASDLLPLGFSGDLL